MPTAVILLAAGNGRRMNGAVDDKVLAPLAGKPLFCHSAAAFLQSGVADFFLITYRDQKQLLALSALAPTPALFVPGGRERRDSVANALAALPHGFTRVFIHDCARPFVRPEQIAALDKIAAREKAAALARRVTDTIKRRAPGDRLRDVPREHLWAMETPQVFDRALITRAYNASARAKLTDDTAAVERLRHPVALLENPWPNPKLTTPADLPFFEFLLRNTA